MKMQEFTFRDARVAVTDTGRGRPVLFVPGLGGRMSFWSKAASALSREFRVLSFDYPGCGGSETRGHECGVADLAALCAELLDACGVSEAAIVGHSMGGVIAQSLALDAPGRVSALVLSSTWAKPDAYFTRLFENRLEVLRGLGVEAYFRAQALVAFSPGYVAANEDAVQRFEQDSLRGAAPADLIASRIRALLEFNRSGELGSLRCPALAAAIRNDAVVPPHMTRKLAELVPGAGYVEYDEEGGHFAPCIDPSRLCEEVERFLRGTG